MTAVGIMLRWKVVSVVSLLSIHFDSRLWTIFHCNSEKLKFTYLEKLWLSSTLVTIPCATFNIDVVNLRDVVCCWISEFDWLSTMPPRSTLRIADPPRNSGGTVRGLRKYIKRKLRKEG